MTTYAWDAYIPDVVALTGRVEATWGNAMRDRTVQIFDTLANLKAALPGSPGPGQRGQVAYVSDGAPAGFYTYYGLTSGWMSPWDAAWGTISSTSITTDGGTYTAYGDITGLATSAFTVITHRLHRVTFTSPFHNSGGSDQGALAKIYRTTSSVVTQLSEGSFGANSATDGNISVVWVGSLPAGTHTITPAVGHDAGGTVALFSGAASGPAQLLVEDIGPNGASPAA